MSTGRVQAREILESWRRAAVQRAKNGPAMLNSDQVDAVVPSVDEVMGLLREPGEAEPDGWIAAYHARQAEKRVTVCEKNGDHAGESYWRGYADALRRATRTPHDGAVES